MPGIMNVDVGWVLAPVCSTAKPPISAPRCLGGLRDVLRACATGVKEPAIEVAGILQPGAPGRRQGKITWT